MDKRAARLCQVNKISNKCILNRDREILDQLLLRNPLALDLVSIEPRDRQKHPGDV
jgi:hypothetical protein